MGECSRRWRKKNLGLRQALDRRVLEISPAQRRAAHVAAQRLSHDRPGDRPLHDDKSDRLYVLDPVACSGSLFWMAVGARMAVALPGDA